MCGMRSIICVLLLAGVSSAAVRKNNVSLGDARRELGVVAAYQDFPDDFSIYRFAVLNPAGEYYHLYLCELPEYDLWRTLVYANSGDYLGYYETIDPPVAFEKDAIVYPGMDASSESGDFDEDDYDSGNAYYIRFSAHGPPDEVKFENRTFRFVSSPRRIRPENPAYRFNRIANRLKDSVNSGRYKVIREEFSPEALERIPEEKTAETLEMLRRQFGRIERVNDPWVQAPDTAVLPIIFRKTAAGLRLTLSDDDLIVGMWVLPFDTAFPDIGQHQTPLQLPFDGRWRVMWGGGTRDTSKYFGSRVSHHAREFVVANRFGRTYSGEGLHNEDYRAFGKLVRAPAAGTVIAVIDGVADNRPHYPNPFDRLGNAVMIEHSTNEYSVVGHLMNNSIRVRRGERVQAGLPIGLCGNSGDSSQPSVYFHLQDSRHLLAGSGYAPVFRHLYVWKGGRVDIVPEYEPVRGEYVQQRSAPQEAPAARQGAEAETGGD